MKELMKAQYQILSELRRVDEKVTRLQTDIERIPEEVGKLQGALAGRKAEYDKMKSLFDACEKKLRKSEQDLRDREDKLNKAEGKMMEVKTNEEYQAAIKENSAQKTEKSGAEDEVLKLINEVEEQRRQLKDVEKNFLAYESVVKEDVKKLDDERARISKLLDEQLEKRGSMSANLDPEVGLMYSRIASRIKGVAVVQVENGMCLGCHMKMRPQLYNEILGFKAIHRCPSCGRILIIVPKEEQAQDSEAAG